MASTTRRAQPGESLGVKPFRFALAVSEAVAYLERRVEYYAARR
jgi:hypothetical protein